MEVKTKEKVQFEPFKPAWWAWNAHVHTVVASQFSRVNKPAFERVEIPTPDDDFLEVDVSPGQADRPIVALFHGLEGSTDRYYIANLMTELRAAGYSSAALSFRSCGSRMNRQPRFYHSGETEDYRTFFKWLEEEYPNKEIYAVGYSLGANALVKYLGEEGSRAKVKKAVAVSPPFDLKGGSLNMHRGFNRVYEYKFLKTLVEKLKIKKQRYPELPDFNGNSIYEFDDQVTAPMYGFEDADDYYHQSSSKHFYQDVRSDLLVIHSRKDTLCPIEYAPLKLLEEHDSIDILITEEGGHVGFLSQPEGWLFRTIINWMDDSLPKIG